MGSPAAAPPGTPAPTPPPWKAEVADKDELIIIIIETTEAMKSIKPREAAVIETVETTEPIISIEVSVAKASEARG
jgi:hypothetical protein